MKHTRIAIIGAGVVVVAAVAAVLYFVLPAKASGQANAEVSDLIQKAGLQELKSDTKIVDFELASLTGSSTKLSSYKGKVVLLNFWATWCGPCRSEIPSLQALYSKYKDQGLVVLGVDFQEDPSTVREYVRQEQMTYPVLLDSTGKVGIEYGARGIPLTFIIDKKGHVTSGMMGARLWNTPDAEALVTTLLKS